MTLLCKSLFVFKYLFFTIASFMVFYKLYNQTINILQYFKHISEKQNSDEESIAMQDGTLKYILMWTTLQRHVFKIFKGAGQKKFVDLKCPFTNCFVTENINILNDYTKIHAIVFEGRFLDYNKIPKKRSPFQKYVFASMESGHYYPVCDDRFNGFFNWTWTFKLNSDLRFGYITVRDTNGTIVGPKKDMHWMRHEDMKPLSEQLKETLRRKTKAAAWFVSNCHAKSGRLKYVQDLKELLRKYNLDVDVYGDCGKLKCTRDTEKECDELIRQDYYFYLAFENSFSEDYVTEKLLHALEFNAVPIVYGGANYSRFLPNGSYLNAREFTAEEIATKMYELINNFDQYVEYFRWTNHYRYHNTEATPETNQFCGMCELLNDDSKFKQVSIYDNFTNWWNDGLCYKNNCMGIHIPKTKGDVYLYYLYQSILILVLILY